MYLRYRLLPFVFLVACMLATTVESALSKNLFSQEQRAEVEQILRDHIDRNPEIIRDALIKLGTKEATRNREARETALRKNKELVFNSKTDFVAGNPNGDVTLVLFFDYNCSYCRLALPVLKTLLETDPGVRLVLKEFPALGSGSLETARLALASIRQGQYFAYHQALLSRDNGRLDTQSALKIAEQIGLDTSQLERDSKSQMISDILAATSNLASQLRISGTPSYIIGDSIIDGMVDLPVLREHILALRKKNKQ